MKHAFVLIAALAVFTTGFAQYVEIGNGGVDSEFPWSHQFNQHSVTRMNARFLYLASEINYSGLITEFGFRNSGTVRGAHGFTNATITMWHTSATRLATQDPPPPEAIIVIQRANLSVGEAGPGAWESYMFDTPFEYNGSQSLIVDVVWQGSGTGTVESRLTSAGSRGYRSVQTGNSSNSGPLSGFNDIRLRFGAANPAPVLSGISPDGGVPGERLDVRLTGSDFVPMTAVCFGPGITLNAVTMPDNDEIIADVTISTNAAPGPRDVSVTNPGPGGGTATLVNRFTVAATGINTEPPPASPGSYLRLEPNPVTNGTVLLKAPAIGGKQAETGVFDITGRELMRRVFDADELAAGVQLDLESLSTGTYLVRVRTDRYTETRSLVIW